MTISKLFCALRSVMLVAVTALTFIDAPVAFSQFTPTSRSALGQKFSLTPLSLDSPTFKALYISPDLGSHSLRFGHVDMAICGVGGYSPRPCNQGTGVIGATELIIPERIQGTLIETWLQNVGGADVEPQNRAGQLYEQLHAEVKDARTISLTCDLSSGAARFRIYFVIATP